jgi:DNA-binding CsgD family transcriptional regulator
MNATQLTEFKSAIEAADVSRELCGLPLVPTLDWCDRAAACLTGVSTPCYAAIVIGSPGRHGAAGRLEAAGVAASLPTGTRLQGVGSARPETTRLGIESAALRLLKQRCARFEMVGLVLDDDRPGRPRVLGAAALRGGRDWRTGPLADVWAGQPVAEPIVGVVPLNGASGGCVIAAMVAPALPWSVNPGAASVLLAVLPILAERAAGALGAAASDRHAWLTEREQEVLALLTLGRSVKQIAEVLWRSPHTVHNHVKSLHRKLHASSRGALVARALGHVPGCDSSLLIPETRASTRGAGMVR